MILENPRASLRQIATASGISLGTVRDVRDRLARGEGPVLVPQRRSGQAEREVCSAPSSVGVLAVPTDD